MPQANHRDPKRASRKVNAIRVTASAFGVYAGLLGMEHGYFEALQGNVPPRSLKILAVSPSELPFPFGHEPAMTVLPTFLVTGIAAILVGLAIVLWSAFFVQQRHGALVLLLLSASLLVVGGGFGPISLLIVACIASANLRSPLTWWRGSPRRGLPALWAWAFGAALLWVPAEFAAGQILGLHNDHRQSLSNLNLILTYPMLGLFALSLIAAFAREAERQGD